MKKTNEEIKKEILKLWLYDTEVESLRLRQSYTGKYGIRIYPKKDEIIIWFQIFPPTHILTKIVHLCCNEQLNEFKTRLVMYF